MDRNFSATATVLSLRDSGENNSSVTLFTQTDGIICATLYGGPKSRMRSAVCQWNTGTVYIYGNPTGGGRKITDFDVTGWHGSFGKSLFKMWAASLAAELVIKTRCAGSSGKCWKLFSGFLDGLEIADEAQGRTGLLRFIWRYLELMGVQPDASSCGRCGKPFLSGKFAGNEVSYLDIQDNSFICPDCADGGSGALPLTVAGIRYLSAVSGLAPAESRKIPLDTETFMLMRRMLFFLAESSAETRLNSLETGAGIL